MIDEKKILDHDYNKITVYINNNCTLKFIESLYEEGVELYEGFRSIHQCMKKDYSKLIGESVRISREYIEAPKCVESLCVSKLSSEIQGIS